MKKSNRNIVIIVVAIGLLLFCCLVAGGIVLVANFLPTRLETGMGSVASRSEQTFQVGRTPTLQVDIYAGDILVRSGAGEQVSVMVTLRAASERDLEEIEVDVGRLGDGVWVRAPRPEIVPNDSMVGLEITVPEDARLELATDAGNVEVVGVRRAIAARTSAGNVSVEGAAGPVTLRAAAGNISYEGRPTGENTLLNGTGNITLRLPADADAALNLNTGVGNIDVEGFDVRGETGGRSVDGVIGTGESATIEATTRLGDIYLLER